MSLGLDVKLYSAQNEECDLNLESEEDDSIREIDEETRKSLDAFQEDAEDVLSTGFVEVNEDGNIAENDSSDEFGDDSDSDIDL